MALAVPYKPKKRVEPHKELDRIKTLTFPAVWQDLIDSVNIEPVVEPYKDIFAVYKYFLGDVQLGNRINFCSGASFQGKLETNPHIVGVGTLMFPNGVQYKGDLYDCDFNGPITITYPNGCKIFCYIIRSSIVYMKFVFADGLAFAENNWEYCQSEDRRFLRCIENGLQPVGKIRVTRNDFARDIPDGCYDTEEGFYDPAKKCLLDPENLDHILRIPTDAEEKRIMKKCRIYKINHIGPKKSLIEPCYVLPSKIKIKKSSQTEIAYLNMLEIYRMKQHETDSKSIWYI